MAPSFGQGRTGSPCSPVQGDGLLGLDRGLEHGSSQTYGGLALLDPQGPRSAPSLSQGLGNPSLPLGVAAHVDGLLGLDISFYIKRGVK